MYIVTFARSSRPSFQLKFTENYLNYFHRQFSLGSVSVRRGNQVTLTLLNEGRFT